MAAGSILSSRTQAHASTPLVTAEAGLLDVLYRDEALIVVNKPSGLASHRGLSNEYGDYVLTRVRDAVGQQVYLAHRLDRATSGAIALVLEPRWVDPIQRAIQENRVDKRYWALTRGVVPEQFAVDYAIPRSFERPDERVSALTEFKRLAVFEDRYSLVEGHPLTGRYHQIRRHLKHLHHPIIGDTTYGDGKENRKLRERFGLMRLVLHAARLSLPHPVSGEMLHIEAPLMSDLSAPFAAMGFSLDTKSSELSG
ncbi:MAG: tRNA pseudouridine synthase [Myxococcaceae bacterium]|nr:tRNA pseudouridine synthase [Myxococcaceae bacterium]